MHTASAGKIKVRQAMVSALSVIRASANDVAVIDEAWKLEKQFRAEMAELEKGEKEPELALAGTNEE